MQKLSYKTSQENHRKYPSGTVGVTTILGIVAKEPLLYWASEMGGADMKRRAMECQSIDDIQYLIPDKSAHRKVSEKQASIGSLAHHRCEAYVRGMEPDFSDCDIPQEILDNSELSFQKFLWWYESQGYTLLHSELPLTSEAYGFSGTLDLVVQNKAGEVELLDIKTSKAYYPEMAHQVGTYKYLFETCHEPLQKIKTCRIVRIGKDEPADFSVTTLTPEETKHGWEVFKACLALYKLLRKSKTTERRM